VKHSALILTTLLLFAGANLQAQAPQLPALPRSTVNLTLPVQGSAVCPTLTTGSDCIRDVPAGSAAGFQSTINAATCGDTIVLAAGSTYSGNFTIPATSCTGWIEIVSSELSSLPSPGNRVGPSNVSNMAIVSTPNTSSAIQFLPDSNHWRLIGLEITTSYVSTSAVVFSLVGSGSTATVASRLPNQIIFDRSYILGPTNGNVEEGIRMDMQAFAMVDSYCDQIHYNANDSQCLVTTNGTGPFLIQDNFIQAAGENIMFGGSDPSIPNLVPSDITIIDNLIQKNTAWDGEAAPYNWVVKNLFEIKNAQRVLLDGNVIQYTWAAGQDEAIIVRSAAQDDGGGCPWCEAEDVTITHNLIQHAPIAIVIAPTAYPNPSIPTQRVLVSNNLLVDISATNWGGAHGWGFQLGAAEAPVPIMHDITIDHNTAFPDNVTGNGPPYDTFVYLGDSGTIPNIQITNNISNYGNTSCCGGITGGGTISGNSTLSTYSPGAIYNDMVFVNSSGNSSGYPAYPTGTYWSTRSGVHFTNYSSGNYQLTSSSSYYRAGTDGKDIGVWDWTCLNADSAAALAGTFTPTSSCAMSQNTPPRPPTGLTATVQ
jgi:hypothetical protein